MIDYSGVENSIEVPIYPKRGITIVKGKNALIWDSDGKEYIDCVSGIGVASVGHCNEHVVSAINEQSRQLITCPEIFHNDKRAELYEKLIAITPSSLNKVFLCNSGAESIEAAIKFSRYSTGKTDFICAVRGFHGRTMGALSATHQKKYREGFEPLLPGFHHVPFNNFEKLSEKVTGSTAGIILEVVQGEGGIRIARKDFLKKVRELCTAKGILLIIDEVQTGFCRTGEMFAFTHFDIEPDILCLAKAIAGGFPMGAVVCSSKVHMKVGKHGTTNGGNPLACAAAIAAIDFMLEFDLAKQAREKGDYFRSELSVDTYRNVREIRGLGLMTGIELKTECQPYITRLMEMGVLTLPAGKNVIRFLPPLTIEQEYLDKVIQATREVLS